MSNASTLTHGGPACAGVNLPWQSPGADGRPAPRVRGVNLYRSDSRQCHAGGPACAGVNLAKLGHLENRLRRPRVRGGESGPSHDCRRIEKAAPRARG